MRQKRGLVKLKNSSHGTVMHVRIDMAMTLFTYPGTRRSRRTAKRIMSILQCGSKSCHCGIYIDRSRNLFNGETREHRDERRAGA